MLNDGWRVQLASDLDRDGLGIELMNEHQIVVAEVFRCDADHTLTFNIFESLDFVAIEWLMAIARIRLGPFQDGSPLPTALGHASMQQES